jgi:ceramide glucosyltransferase
MAFRRDVLDEIGGFDALGAHIGDVYLLGKLVSERGYRVALAPYVVRNVVHERSFRSLVLHELRWARTIRAQRPLGYASLLLTQPVLCALILVGATRGSPAGWVAFAAAVASRAIVAVTARNTFTEWQAPLSAVPLRDGITAAVWMAGFFARDVWWRGRSLSVGNEGRLDAGRPKHTEA